MLGMAMGQGVALSRWIPKPLQPYILKPWLTGQLLVARRERLVDGGGRLQRNHGGGHALSQ